MSKPILYKECSVCNTIFYKSRNVSTKAWDLVGFCCDNCRRVFISGFVPEDPMERLLLRTVDAPGGCRLFDGDIRGGFGSAVLCGKKDFIHRVAYRIAYGELPDNKEIGQLCGNARCINPDHFVGMV
jgi:hypothetical protein